MGNPQNYSLELPDRCLILLDELWPFAQKVYLAKQTHLGPLTSTFLLSMSMPIINLPIERIERCSHKLATHYASDQFVDPAAAAAILETLRSTTFGKAPFFTTGAWRFVNCKAPPFPNIAEGLPDELAQEFETESAASNAATMPVSQWCSILRNALAHGGIAYLNEKGRTSYGEPVKMYVFVSGKYAPAIEGGPLQLTAVNLLRISEVDYWNFLHHWVAWLRDTGIAKLSEAA